METVTNKSFRGLWRNTDFLKLWAGETISLFGSKVTSLALPIAAAVTQEATPAQMGFLNAFQFAPFLLVTLFAGVWIDQNRRRPILIGANIGRALLLGLIPVAYWLDLLRMEFLYVIAFLVGVLTVLFDLAYQSYLPSLVEREELVEGNSKLQASASLADVGGPGLAGVVIGVMTAPVAILIDAISFLLSACTLSTIRKPEPIPKSPCTERTSVFRNIGVGLRVVFGNSVLRSISFTAASYNLFNQVLWAVVVLFMTRELNFSSGVIGFTLAAASVGALCGSLYAGRAGKRWGIGPSIVGAMLIGCASLLLLPLADGPLYVAVPVLVLGFFINGFGVVLWNVHVVSLRQAITPPHLLGRMTASYRFFVTGAASIGALIGGTLGTLVGLRLTLLIGGLGTLVGLLFVLLSEVPKMRQLP